MIREVKSKKVKGKTFRNSSTGIVWFSYFSFCLFTFCFLLSTPARAQVDEPPKDAAPPPMIFIPKEERKQIEMQKDIKKRTELSIDLLETHLQKAETLSEQSDFQSSLGELGNFHGILANVLDYLNSRDNNSDKVNSNFKRLEINLRKIVPRLEILRRGMPFNYGYYVQKLQKFVRDARSKALDPLFDDSVVPQRKTQ